MRRYLAAASMEAHSISAAMQPACLRSWMRGSVSLYIAAEVHVFPFIYGQPKDDRTFSNIWTEYHPRFSEFLRAYQQDLQRYGQNPGLEAKPGTPANSFPVSMIPWTTFDGFNLNLPNGAGYLLPIFTMGKFYQQEDRYWLPLSVQVHHGVCDGFHLCRSINELQELIRQEGIFAAGEPV